MKIILKSISRALFAGALAALASSPASACRVSIDFSESVPWNAVDIGNKARLRLADAVLRTKAWVGVDVGATISAPAFLTEHDPRRLSELRAESVKMYLSQLGLKPENILFEPTVIDNPVASDSVSREKLREVYVEFVPLCTENCERFCNVPPR